MPIKASKLKNDPPLSEEELAKRQKEYHKILDNLAGIDNYYYPYTINIAEERAAIATIQQSDPTDFQAIATHLLELSNDHYTSVRIKSEKSFSWTIRAYSAALIFFLFAAVFFILHQTNVSYFTALGTALAGLFGGLIQAHGRQVDKEAKQCRVNLDRIQRFIVANSACESLNDAEKQQKRSEIISKLVE